MSPLSEHDYVQLAAAAEICPEIVDIINRNGGANWTACPCCRCDDFNHMDGCRVENAVAVEMLKALNEEIEF